MNDRTVIAGMTLTKRGERVLTAFSVFLVLAAAGIVGGWESGTLWPFNNQAQAAAVQPVPLAAASPIAQIEPRPVERRVVDRASRLSSNRSLGRAIAATYGITGKQWDCLDRLWHRESRWDNRARNTSSGAYGIPQKMGHPIEGTRKQIEWGIAYIEKRYGSPCEALSFQLRRGWY